MAERKKISKLLADVRPPLEEIKEEYFIEPERDKPVKIFEVKRPKKKILGLFNEQQARLAALIGIFVVVFLVLGLSGIKSKAEESMKLIFGEVPKIKEAIPELNMGVISGSLELADKEIKEIESAVKNYGLSQASSLLGVFIPSLGKLPGALKNVSQLSDKLVLISRDLEYLKGNGLQLVFGKKGDDFINVLERMTVNLDEIESLNREIKDQAPSLKNLSSKLASLYDVFNKNYIYINLNVARVKRSLDAVLSLLKPSVDTHFLLIFQNPSEMRPAGGFIGSHGDMVINRGSMNEFKIDDIYNADRQMDSLLMAPQELQGITKDWGARDANWFFDFPTSAQKVMSLLEQSDLYSRRFISFSGAIAVNTDVLGTIIEVVGPIEIPAYKMMLNKDNFLKEIQYEVEAGQDKKPGQNPKKVLSVLFPAIMERFGKLDDSQKNLLIKKFKEHFEKKDIMVYFRDWRLEGLMEDLGIAGEVMKSSKDYNGDYLGVVNANIAGGKTDAVITQQISLKSEISSDGKVLDKLEISRKHSGKNEKDWWYTMTNKNYSKILVPFGSKLVSVRGGDGASLKLAEYSNNYKYDADLEALEKTMKFSEKFNMRIGSEFGKASFGTWFSTAAGKTSTLKVSYETSADVGDNVTYSFVFEKQSGTRGSLYYAVTAPTGYVWKENGGQVFEYRADSPNARERVDLTMVKSEN